MDFICLVLVLTLWVLAVEEYLCLHKGINKKYTEYHVFLHQSSLYSFSKQQVTNELRNVLVCWFFPVSMHQFPRLHCCSSHWAPEWQAARKLSKHCECFCCLSWGCLQKQEKMRALTLAFDLLDLSRLQLQATYHFSIYKNTEHKWKCS